MRPALTVASVFGIFACAGAPADHASPAQSDAVATVGSDPCPREGGFCFYECLGTWRPSDQCAGRACCTSASYPGGAVPDGCCFETPAPYRCELLISSHVCVAAGAGCPPGFEPWADWSCDAAATPRCCVAPG